MVMIIFIYSNNRRSRRITMILCATKPKAKPIMYHPRRPRGSQSGRVKRRDKSFQSWAEELFRLYLKTFVAAFLPARLTAPGSPRMIMYFL